MNKTLAQVLYYGIYGLLATVISVGLVPLAFTGTGYPTYTAYGVVMAALMYAGNRLELQAWSKLTADQANSLSWRLLVRLGIYLGVPTIAVWLIGLTGLAWSVPAGLLTALALCWMPLMVGAMLNYFPARSR